MATQTKETPETENIYLSIPPAQLSQEQFDHLWIHEIRPIISTGKNDRVVANLLAYMCKGAIYLSVEEELVFMHSYPISYGSDAFYDAAEVAIAWANRFIDLSRRPEEDELSSGAGNGGKIVEFLQYLISRLSSSESRRAVKSLLEEVLRAEIRGNQESQIKKYELPVILTNSNNSDRSMSGHGRGGRRISLGKLSLSTGKIEKITGLAQFPILSGLKFHDSYSLPTNIGEKQWKSSKFHAYLAHLVGGNEEKINFLLRLMAVYLEEGNSRHIWTWIMGPAGNGKSVFVDLLALILGDLATKGDNEAYNGAGQEQRFARAAMEGKRLAYFSELSKGFRLHDGKLKGDTEGRVRIEQKHRDSKEIVNTCKPLFVSNFSVHIQDETEATRGRLIYIETEGSNWRESDERIYDYHLTLWREEQDLILAKIIEAYQSIELHGLQIPLDNKGTAQINKAKTSYIPDEFKDYIENRIVKSENPDSRLYASTVLEDYKIWRNRNGYGEVNNRIIWGLRNAMSNLYGPCMGKSNAQYRLGLRLKTKLEEDKDEEETREFSHISEIELHKEI